MKKNVGAIDKGIRIILALIIAALYTLGVIGGGFGAFLGIVALVLIATSALSYCPLYQFLGLSTRREAAA